MEQIKSTYFALDFRGSETDGALFDTFKVPRGLKSSKMGGTKTGMGTGMGAGDMRSAGRPAGRPVVRTLPHCRELFPYTTSSHTHRSYD